MSGLGFHRHLRRSPRRFEPEGQESVLLPVGLEAYNFAEAVRTAQGRVRAAAQANLDQDSHTVAESVSGVAREANVADGGGDDPVGRRRCRLTDVAHVATEPGHSRGPDSRSVCECRSSSNSLQLDRPPYGE